MRLRLSNGHSFAVEFHAANEAEYRHGFRRAALSFFVHEGQRATAYLHVSSDYGEWMSPNYPRSNDDCVSRFGRHNRPSWSQVCLSNQRSTWFRHELNNLSGFVSSP